MAPPIPRMRTSEPVGVPLADHESRRPGKRPIRRRGAGWLRSRRPRSSIRAPPTSSGERLAHAPSPPTRRGASGSGSIAICHRRRSASAPATARSRYPGALKRRHPAGSPLRRHREVSVVGRADRPFGRIRKVAATNIPRRTTLRPARPRRRQPRPRSPRPPAGRCRGRVSAPPGCPATGPAEAALAAMTALAARRIRAAPTSALGRIAGATAVA